MKADIFSRVEDWDMFLLSLLALIQVSLCMAVLSRHASVAKWADSYRKTLTEAGRLVRLGCAHALQPGLSVSQACQVTGAPDVRLQCRQNGLSGDEVPPAIALRH